MLDHRGNVVGSLYVGVRLAGFNSLVNTFNERIGVITVATLVLAIALAIPNMEWNNLIMDMREAEPHLLEPRNRLYIYKPENTDAERWLTSNYPNGQLLRFQAFQSDKDFMVFYAPAQQ